MAEKTVKILIQYDTTKKQIVATIDGSRKRLNNNVNPLPDRLTWIVKNDSKHDVGVRVFGFKRGKSSARPFKDEESLCCVLRKTDKNGDFGARIRPVYKKGVYTYSVLVLAKPEVVITITKPRGPDIEIY